MAELQQTKRRVLWCLPALIILLVSTPVHLAWPSSQTRCPNPLMAIVAHEDDDLLFMNPGIASALHNGRCVRVVYLTAGDEGQGTTYWRSREKGVEAAYASMTNSPNTWGEHTVELRHHEFIQIANLKGDDAVTLIFVRLPDGSTKGQGFSATQHTSLAKLISSQIAAIQTVDGRSSYTANQLQAALDSLMVEYTPAEIYTQAISTDGFPRDHSDHTATGKITITAYMSYLNRQKDTNQKKSLSYYLGYPAARKPANLAPNDAIAKERAFLAYAHYDKQACPATFICTNYSAYFTRQYRTDSSAANHPSSHDRSPLVGL